MTSYGIRAIGFVCNTVTGNQTISIPSGSGSAETPKAVLFMVGRATALDTNTNTAMQTVGATDGINSRVVCWMGENNIAALSADTGCRIDNAAVIQTTTAASQAIDSRATFVSFGAGSVTINWADAPAAAWRAIAVFFFGADMQCNVTSFAASAALDGTASTTAPGFTPDGIIAAANIMVFQASAGAGEGLLSVGFSGRSPSITNSCAAVCAEDRQANTSSGNIVRNDAIVSRLTSAAGVVTETARLEVTAYQANGFEITNRIAGVAQQALYLSFRIAGNKVFCAAPTVDTDATGIKAVTGVGFMPMAVFSSVTTATAINTVDSATSGSHSFGVAARSAGATDVGLIAAFFNDDVGTSAAQAYVSETNFLLTFGTGGTLVAAFSSMDADGYSVNVSTADSADRQVAYMAIDGLKDLNWLDARSGNRWRKRLARM